MKSPQPDGDALLIGRADLFHGASVQSSACRTASVGVGRGGSRDGGGGGGRSVCKAECGRGGGGAQAERSTNIRGSVLCSWF